MARIANMNKKNDDINIKEEEKIEVVEKEIFAEKVKESEKEILTEKV